MKIGLISDTHIPSMGPQPPAQVITAFDGVDLIIHAGDVYIDSCIEWLEQIAPVRAATNAFASGAEGSPRVSFPIVVELAGKTIGVIHKLDFYAYADNIYPGSLKQYPASRSMQDELIDIFGQRIDIIVTGYTHEALVETHQDILFINPGSPTMVGDTMRMGSVATLTLDDNGVADVEIIDLTTLPLPATP